MDILSVKSDDFKQFGKVVDGYNFSELLEKLVQISEKPSKGTIYKASDNELESLKIASSISNNLYGGMPIQIGYCNGNNNVLNCLEYHRGSEINIAVDDVVLLVAPLNKLDNNQINSSEVMAFFLPKNTAVMLYETTLHYAPCNYGKSNGFRVVIVLPKDTNTGKPEIDVLNNEDKLLWAKNKWLVAHADSPEANDGALVGIIGENIMV